MKNRLLGLLASMGAGMAALGQPAPAPTPPTVPAHLVPQSLPGAKIKFEEPIFDFGKIKSGDVVKHTFVFTNTGDQPLELINVQPSCGCTTAGEWTRRVEPGQAGSLAVEFRSANFNGPTVKTVTVTSNDKAQPVVVLQVKGNIWKPVDLVPSFAVLNVPPDAGTASTVVKLVNNTDEHVAIISAPESSHKSFAVTVRTNVPGKEFELEISTVPPLAPGNLQSQISVKTTSTNLPVATVTVWANVQAPMVIMPPRVTLPPAPLATRVLPTVTIQNNTTNTLKLSNAAVNVPGVDVTLQEIVPGRAFSITMAFPQGFTLPAGQEVALTVASNQEKNAPIRVPVTQLARPAASASTAVPNILPPAPPPPPSPQNAAAR